MTANSQNRVYTPAYAGAFASWCGGDRKGPQPMPQDYYHLYPQLAETEGIRPLGEVVAADVGCQVMRNEAQLATEIQQ